MAYTVTKLAEYSPAKLEHAFAELRKNFEAEILAAPTKEDARHFRDRWMARKSGILTQLNDLWLKAAPPAAKREVGRLLNEFKQLVEREVEETYRRSLRAHPATADADRLDITLPGLRRPLGAEHPILQTMNDLLAVFRSMGYSIEDGPEVETDYYNFEALNFPPNHPARDTQDTLFVAGQESKPLRERLLLRTHTSPVQIRAMEKHGPPVRIVCPGKVHRHDTADATHSPVFHQIEGLCVDTGITLADLKGTLDYAMKALFGSSVKTRFHPSFFPFTEPSADVSISCIFCAGRGCRICKLSGWIELLGCGMVDPKVFEFVRSSGYDPEKVSGFAWGLGVERIAILKYGVDDIQLFFHGDVRFLEQFG